MSLAVLFVGAHQFSELVHVISWELGRPVLVQGSPLVWGELEVGVLVISMSHVVAGWPLVVGVLGSFDRPRKILPVSSVVCCGCSIPAEGVEAFFQVSPGCGLCCLGFFSLDLSGCCHQVSLA